MATIYWAGDSTVMCNTVVSWPQTGIGQEFGRFLRRDTGLEIHAGKGYSAKSFVDGGCLEPICRRIGPGDFLFIQFGHNDERKESPDRYADPDSTFPAYLERFIAAARERGAVPVLITPVTRCNRHAPSMLYRHGPWAEAIRRTGARLGVAVVDLTTLSEQLVDALSPEAQSALYLHLPAGAYPHFPLGQRDNTHLQAAGAVAFGGLIARALHDLGAPYADLLCDDFDRYLQENSLVK